MNSVIRDIYFMAYSNDWSSIRNFTIRGYKYIQSDNVKAYNFIKKYKTFEVENG